MRLRLVALAALVVALSGVAASSASAQRHVVRTVIERPPDRTVRHRHFTPTAEPSFSEVYKIEALEQARWGGPSLANRIYCESTNQWWVTNGPYRGLAQIGSWWESTAWPVTPRGVSLPPKVRYVKKWVRRVRHYSDGTKVIHRAWPVKVKIVIKRHGRLPADATPFNGWAAIRVAQRAVSGDGPSTYWQCSLKGAEKASG